jgi:anti-anti-sigma regulatory factor
MTLKIERVNLQQGFVLRLIGRVGAEHLEELRSQLSQGEGGSGGSIDLGEVNLLDVEAVRFLVESENLGVEISNPSPYIREWMNRIRGSNK